jgi:tetratricopeptide (TPR) repeat protein
MATQWAQDFDQAVVYAEQAIELAEPIGARPAVARSHLTIGYIHALSGRLEQGSHVLDKAIAISRSAGDPGVQSLGLQVASVIKNWQGSYAEASLLAGEGLRIAREHNLLIPLIRALWNHALVLAGKGDYDEALALMQEGLALTEKIGDEGFNPRYLNSIGWIQSECEDLDRALDVSGVAAERARSWRHAVGVEITAYSEINRGDIFMAKGDLILASEALGAAQGIVTNPKTHDWMKWRYSTHLLVSSGELWLARGDLEKAKGFADQCLENATRTNSRKYLVRGWRLRGEIDRGRRQWDAAETALRQAVSIGEAVGNPPQLWKAQLALGRLYQETQKPEAARRAFRAGRVVVERMKTNLRDPELRESLERSPQVRELYHLAAGEDETAPSPAGPLPLV